MDTPSLPLTSRQLIQASRGNTAPYDGDYQFHRLRCGIRIHGGSLRAWEDITCRRVVKPYTAFIMLIEGGLRFALGAEQYEIHAGSEGRAVLINLSSPTLFTRFLQRNEPLTKLTISGLESWLVMPPSMNIHHNIQHWSLTTPLLHSAKTWLQDTHSDDLASNAFALKLLDDCWQTYQNKINHHCCLSHPHYDSDLAFINRLEQAYANGAKSINALMIQLNMSRRTLQRKVHDTTGLSLQRWLINCKMQYALMQLTEEHLSIGEVAYNIGYRHPSNFIQAFKQYYGVTPSILLKQHHL